MIQVEGVWKGSSFNPPEAGTGAESDSGVAHFTPPQVCDRWKEEKG